MRYFFDISYNGTAYHGWQIQQNAISVQQIVQEKLALLTNAPIEIVGSGRTDAGVHALKQVFHADFKKSIDPEDFKYHLNSMLPGDIFVKNIRLVRADAHARFDATSRRYKYIILNKKDPFLPSMAYVYHRVPDAGLLNRASTQLLGKQDFKTFSKVKTQVNNFICEITEAQWQQEGEKSVFYITANRFLRGMVRAIVGILLEINEQKLSVEELPKRIKGKNRQLAGRSVPPCGLYLMEVNYPNDIYLND